MLSLQELILLIFVYFKGCLLDTEIWQGASFLQWKRDRYPMEVAREAKFSDREQIILRNAIMVLNVHIVSDITTLDGTQIKPRIQY